MFFLKINNDDIDLIYNLGKNNLPIYYGKNDIKYMIKSNDYELFKVMYKNKIVAYIICQKITKNRLHINSLAVEKKYRRNGIGAFMIKKIKLIFNNYKYITLYVSTNNNNALKLYFKNNFKILKIKKNYYSSLNEDAYFMLYNKNKNYKIKEYNKNNIIIKIIIFYFILFILLNLL